VIDHIAKGMYGALIVDPPDLPPKMTNEQWDAVVFNGYVNQYQHAPMRVFVTHKFASAAKGALGVFQAGEVAGAEVGAH
jgi:hypothetical protein